MVITLRESALNFKDAAPPRLGYNNVVYGLLLVANIKCYSLSISHQQNRLIDGYLGTFDI